MIQRAQSNSRPTLEELETRSSNLMLEATGHAAKKEVFDAAIDWMSAGRTLAELASRLLQEDSWAEAAQEILRAAGCFLETGDPRPADVQLQRFTTLPKLQEALKAHAHLRDEHAELARRSRTAQGTLEPVRQEWVECVGGPKGASGLRRKWIDTTLRKMPGLAEVHWFASDKYWLEGEKKGNKSSLLLSVRHNQWCVGLMPERLGLRIVLVHRLLDLRRWEDAKGLAGETVSRFPNVASAHFFSGWTLETCVRRGCGPKRLLDDAIAHLQKAVDLPDQLTLQQRVGIRLCVVGCYRTKGQEGKARDELRQIVTDYPAEVSDIAVRLLESRGTAFAQLLESSVRLAIEDLQNETNPSLAMVAEAA